jgi:HYR domain
MTYVRNDISRPLGLRPKVFSIILGVILLIILLPIYNVHAAPPTIQVPNAELKKTTQALTGTTVNYAITAKDDNNQPIVYGQGLSCDPGPGAKFPLGPNLVTCQAQDPPNPTRYAHFYVTVIRDNTEPTMTLPDSPLIVTTQESSQEIAVTYETSATDAIDGDIIPECDPASGSLFEVDETTSVNCNARDSAGNVAEGTFEVSVQKETIPPPPPPPPPIALIALIGAGAAGVIGIFFAWRHKKAKTKDIQDIP